MKKMIILLLTMGCASLVYSQQNQQMIGNNLKGKLFSQCQKNSTFSGQSVQKTSFGLNDHNVMKPMPTNIDKPLGTEFASITMASEKETTMSFRTAGVKPDNTDQKQENPFGFTNQKNSFNTRK